MREKKKKPFHRPLKHIDWDKVDVMLEAHCPGTEIAAYFAMHYQTFYDRVVKEKGMSFTEYQQQKQSKGKNNLRLAQYKKGLKGENQMLIWLGKNWLGQRDEPRQDKEVDGAIAALLEMLKKKDVDSSDESK